MAVAVSKRLADLNGADGSVGRPLRADVERLVTACDIATRDARRLLHDLRDDDRLGAETSISRRVEEVVLEWQTRTALQARVDAADGGGRGRPAGPSWCTRRAASLPRPWTTRTGTAGRSTSWCGCSRATAGWTWPSSTTGRASTRRRTWPTWAGPGTTG